MYPKYFLEDTHENFKQYLLFINKGKYNKYRYINYTYTNSSWKNIFYIKDEEIIKI